MTQLTIGSVGRLYIHDTRPSAKKSPSQRSNCRLDAGVLDGNSSSGRSARGSCRGCRSRFAVGARLRQVSLVECVGVDEDLVPFFRSPRLALRAAGFIATSTSGSSPGVKMSQLAIWTWKDENAWKRRSPNFFGWEVRQRCEVVPKEREAAVNRCRQAACLPESPANRRTTLSRASGSVGPAQSVVWHVDHLLVGRRKPPPAHLCWHRGAAHDRDSLCQMIEVPAHLVWGFRCSADSRARGPTDRSVAAA